MSTISRSLVSRFNPDHRLEGLRGNVVGLPKIRYGRAVNMEVFSDALLVRTSYVSTAHSTSSIVTLQGFERLQAAHA